MLIYIYTQLSGHSNKYNCLNELEIIKKYFGGGSFRFEVLTSLVIKITSLGDVTPCSSVERRHVSKQSYIYIYIYLSSVILSQFTAMSKYLACRKNCFCCCSYY